MSEPVRAFVHHNEAWYAHATLRPDTLDEVMIGLYHKDGGTSGEFAIRWMPLGDNPMSPAPRLEAFDDSWAALAKFPDLMAFLASVSGQNITPDAVCSALRNMGITDQTPRVIAESVEEAKELRTNYLGSPHKGELPNRVVIAEVIEG